MSRTGSLVIAVLALCVACGPRPCKRDDQCDADQRCTVADGAESGLCTSGGGGGEGEGEGDGEGGGEGEGEGEGEGAPALASTIEVGQGFACAIDTLARVQCWGTNFDGELGRITQSGNAPQPAAPVSLLHEVTVLASAVDHSCVVGRLDEAQADVLCWGSPRGFLPDGVGAPEGELVGPVGLPAGFGHEVVSMDADADASTGVTCATDAERTFCFGGAAPGSPDGRATEVEALAGATALFVSLDAICGRVGGSLVCVALGAGAGVLDCSEGAVCPALSSASAFSLSSGNVCRSVGGQIECAGGNLFGVVTPGSPAATDLGFTDVGVDGGTVQVGLQHACAIDSTNAVVCWGRILSLQTGLDSFDDAAFECTETPDVWCQPVTPVPMPVGFTAFTRLSTRRAQSCAIDVLQRVVCWGDLALHQVGETILPTEIVLAP